MSAPKVELSVTQLLASVHQLRPGDLLVMWLPKETPPEVFDRVRQVVNEQLGDSKVPVLVMGENIPLEHYRRVEDDEARARRLGEPVIGLRTDPDPSKAAG